MSYFDHNASTPLHPQVAQQLRQSLERLSNQPGNASSVHRGGREARARVDAARSSVAKVMGCEPREVCFTGSGSEADALAVLGGFRARKDRRRTKVVVSAIEHPAVLMAAAALEAEGAQLVRLFPDAGGRIPESTLEEALGSEVALCSLMWANNETGVVQPAREAARLCRQRGITFHTDAVQAAGKVEVNLRQVDADLLSLSAHKFGGPAGVGVLIVRRGVDVLPLVPGHQENGKRGGTHNVPYVEALALALELADAGLATTAPRLASMRDRLEHQLSLRIEGMFVNGGPSPRVPNTSNLRFEGADGEALLIALDLAGFSVSTGAACASGSLTPSHVLTSMGLTPSQAHASVRLSMGPSTTEEEVDRLIELLVEQVPRAREAALLGA